MSSKVEKVKNAMLGKEFQTRRNGKCFIIDYKGSQNVIVKFYEPPCEVSCHMQALKTGNVSNPLHPSVYNKGFIGIGDYSSKDKGLYYLWKSMLLRSYDANYHNKFPTYKDVSVCEEWLCFQNFAKWCVTEPFFNTEDENGRKYHLDKDILARGNKVYSPETCSFVPSEINTLLLKRNKTRGDLPIGVHFDKRRGKYIAQMNRGVGVRRFLGSFENSEEAFTCYKINKESYIKEVAERWKGKIDDNVYQALLTYQVETTD